MPLSPCSLQTSSVVPAAEDSDREQIGLIGLGLMGSAMAERFLARGFEVLGCDIDSACLAAFVSRGGRAATGVTELATSSRRIILSLPNSEVVQTVLDQLEPHLRPGQLILDTTTGCPEAALAAGRRLAGHRVAYVEGTISGNSSQVRRGEVLVMASGTAEGIAQCDDLFACFAGKVHHVGDWGNASRLKLVTNLVLGLNRAVLAEGLAFAGKLGLRVCAKITSGFGGSAAGPDTRREKGAWPWRPVTDEQRSSRPSAAAESHAWTSLSEIHAQLLQQAESKGLGPLDNSAIIRVFAGKD